MLEALSLDRAALPFREDIELPTHWPFSPVLFRDKFQKWPWYPWEDWCPAENTAKRLFTALAGEDVFAVDFGIQKPPSIVNVIRQPTDAEIVELQDRIDLAGNIFWTESGFVFAHYFSDILLTNLSPELSTAVFDMPLDQVFAESENCFTDLSRLDEYPDHYLPAYVEAVRVVLKDCKSTWGIQESTIQ